MACFIFIVGIKEIYYKWIRRSVRVDNETYFSLNDSSNYENSNYTDFVKEINNKCEKL